MDDDEQLVEEITGEILAYLDAHPAAADSVEGVVQWWIGQQRFLRGLHAVARALDRLVATGQVERVPGPDGRPLYRAGPARRRH
jgi:hypothetical protein